MSGWFNQLMAGFQNQNLDTARNELFPPDDPAQIWRSGNPVGTETLQSAGMPQPTTYAGPVGQFVDPATGQMTSQGQARLDNPALGFDTGGLSGGGLMAAIERARRKAALIDVGNVTAHLNPSGEADIARMMQSAPEHELRAFHDPESGDFAIWPGWHAIHDDMMGPLGFTENAVNMKLHGRVGPPDADYPQKAGRFSFYATADPRPPRRR